AVDSDSSFTETEIVLRTPTGQIFGTLTTPHEADKVPVALLLAGSGPTDRNGNNPLGVKTDAYKQLAHALAEHHIACLRFDKRGIAASWKAGASNEAGLRFEDYINDAAGWIALLRNDKRFSSVIVVGHSEGSLIGMVAAKKANKFVSVAGAGESADKI
ncbi:alpha/beta hydrolase, partial [Novosphingopyxis sp. YJ-S2-01]|uniref:alpha/beta hydrolase n=1 Tax=Novosphingopyxis sp. YJ-S2-01 TaxID=2794021 RepID=UPI0018DC7D7A